MITTSRVFGGIPLLCIVQLGSHPYGLQLFFLQTTLFAYLHSGFCYLNGISQRVVWELPTRARTKHFSA
jgi:hypothetical protein